MLTQELEAVLAALPADMPVYLVGGAVRDQLMGRTTHDLDLVLPGNVLQAARRVANRVGAAYYPLDEERDTARLVFIPEAGQRLVMDFSGFRGVDLEADLRARDFTINALAIDLRQPDLLIDPLGGAVDVAQKRIRPCSSQTFTDDPIRVLRAVRQAVEFKFRIVPEGLKLMRQAAPLLTRPSPERVRDEIYRILDGRSPAIALRILDTIGALPVVLPELSALKGVEQSPPHVSDVWEHTLNLIGRLDEVLSVLHTRYDPDQASNLFLGLAVLRLGRYREQISQHLESGLSMDRSLRPTLFLAALYHDIAKPQTQQRDENGRIRFFEHDVIGAEVAARRGRELRLSNEEVAHLKKIVRHHMRPFLLGHGGNMPTPRAIFRFFRDTGAAGVDICLLSMADLLATQGVNLPQQEWAHHLDVLRALLEAWWERKTELVAPPTLVDGHDLIERFGLPPGRRIGQLLEAVREAQAEGQVRTTEDAYALVEKMLTE